MSRQKALLSIITAAILGVAYPSMSSAQDQVQQNLTVEVVTAYDECRDKYDLQGPAEVPVDCVYELVSHRAKWLSGWVNEWQGLNLERLQKDYPYYGIGIQFVYLKTAESDNYELYRPQIIEVWEGSPADKAGLKPKDVIHRINDLIILGSVINKGTEVEVQFMIDQANMVKGAITNAQDPFTMAVERDGQVIDVELSKATLGQEVADVINRNSAKIESTNLAVRDMVGELVKQVDVSKNDKETLLGLNDQVAELEWYQDGPFFEILDVEADKWQR